MKRVLLSVIVSALCTSAFAQETNESKTRYYRHEVNVSTNHWDGSADHFDL